MAKIHISETQFTFAFFHKYLLLNKHIPIWFLFPTLFEEGNVKSPYGGADLVVNHNMFFQFKMSERLKKANTSEHKQVSNFLRCPYFRFSIKNSPLSCQFNQLQKIAADTKNTAMYVAPLFDYQNHDNDEEAFYQFFNADPHDAMNYVASVNFNQFRGDKLDENNSHKICYSRESVIEDSVGYLFSEPKQIEVKKGVDRLTEGQENQNSIRISNVIEQIIRVFSLSGELLEEPWWRIQFELAVRHNIYWIPEFTK